MSQVYFATKNDEKFNHVERVLSKYGISVTQLNVGFSEPSDALSRKDPVILDTLRKMSHDPSKLRKEAKDKAVFAYQATGKQVIALDAGFYVQALNGFPGAYVKAALEHKSFGLEKLMQLVDDKAKGNRNCKFVNCLAYVDDKFTAPMYFESVSEGTVSDSIGEKRKGFWSELHRIFIPKGYEKTLSAMTKEEYAQYRAQRHGVSFATKFAEWFKNK
jgi:XTP/dITP diphosphohydrolase